MSSQKYMMTWTRRPRHSPRGPPTCTLQTTLVSVQLAQAPFDEADSTDSTGYCHDTPMLLLKMEIGVLPSVLFLSSSKMWLVVACGHAWEPVLLILGFISPRQVWPVHTGAAKTQRELVIHAGYKMHNDIVISGRHFMRRTTTAERFHEHDAKCGVRIVSSEALLLKERPASPRRQAPKTVMAHISICRQWFCVVSLFCSLVLAGCVLEKRAAEQRLKTHLQLWWRNVQREISMKHHRLVDAGLLPLALLQCGSRLLDVDFLITALAIPCSSLLHLALSAVVVGVRPVRQALRRLEEFLVLKQSFMLRAAILLWRAVLTALITCVFAVVAAHMT